MHHGGLKEGVRLLRSDSAPFGATKPAARLRSRTLPRRGQDRAAHHPFCFLRQHDFTGFVYTGTSITDGTTPIASSRTGPLRGGSR